jgi:hypothetical protein
MVTDLSNNLDVADQWMRDHVYCEDCFNMTALGDAEVSNAGTETIISAITQSGDDGVAVYADTTGDTLQLTFAPVNQSTSNSTLDFKVSGTASSAASRTTTATTVADVYLAGVSFANVGGAIQITGDFTAIGDPNVQIAVYNGNSFVGSTTVSGGGVIAITTSAGSGNPQVTSFQMVGGALPVIEIKFDRVAHFTAVNSVAFNGDRIRLISLGATQSITGLTRVEIRAKNMTSFTITNVDFKRGSCCVGFTGNVECDPLDGIDIADLAALIDYLYISFSPLCCPAEANIDCYLLPCPIQGIDIGDLTTLIDFLYISFNPPAPCH